MQTQRQKIYFHLSCTAASLALILYISLLIMPASMRLPNYPNSDTFMQITGYLQLTLLLALVSFHPIKQSLSSSVSMLSLNIIHALLGMSFMMLNIFHVTKLPSGYLLILHLVLHLTVISGAGLLVLKSYISPQLRNITLNLHIASSFFTLAASLVHIYFVYVYTSTVQ
ncbi:MAG: hypothetical protein CVU29_01410 [Betaproteobacteria bacterium HGW-Betaproteobacteria-22]|nr:MAG: hypothetical protein CVU29_01410 [Betaproteobacteria bacterium HGW-Betaproteobacteria-22]